VAVLQTSAYTTEYETGTPNGASNGASRPQVGVLAPAHTEQHRCSAQQTCIALQSGSSGAGGEGGPEDRRARAGARCWWSTVARREEAALRRTSGRATKEEAAGGSYGVSCRPRGRTHARSSSMPDKTTLLFHSAEQYSAVGRACGAEGCVREAGNLILKCTNRRKRGRGPGDNGVEPLEPQAQVMMIMIR
jgi:hypothetical protein